MKDLVIRKVPANQVPIDLLLLADPSEKLINSYLPQTDCYVAKNKGQVIGACVVKKCSASAVEIMNVAVYPNQQGKGTGTQLLAYVIHQALPTEVTQVRLGTGTFGYQLTFYQRMGFRVVAVERDYFLNNYDEPLFESGIQHKDRLVLELLI
ncbi:GNAT family N-acetyltransferase [Tunicatimonas pelagia]|uniref:GNAT family N-acetyltransferase n=1 Tax=Tunicatimonas pelagia TaxID=931531 RepID=UPI002666393A|nr:GNAT family N-acetyltransferase [Tunicatimonas pelagia]WKN41760.1 GNAT family N-acetyltransferase [Tunicatimonas pelagia]